MAPAHARPAFEPAEVTDMITTYTSYSLITRDIQQSLARVAEKPDVARETEYYLANIGKIKSIDDFMADSRINNYALNAHGLEDMAYAQAIKHGKESGRER